MESLNIDNVQHYSPDPADPVLFYGGPFSNFVGGPFQIEALQPWQDEPFLRTYHTVEHFFQASKAFIKGQHQLVADTYDTWQAKSRGQKVDLRQDWEAVKYEVMLVGLRVKFDYDPFRRDLLATGDRYIAEDSPTDFIWGIRDKNGGTTGRNLLGKALMQVREEIQKEVG